MAFSSLPTFTQDKVVDIDYLNQAKENLDDHETRLAQVVGSIIPNGSFESFEAAAPYYPNNWTRFHYTGGSSGTQASGPADGARCLYITSPGGSGNGGGYYDSDYVFCNALRPVNLHFSHISSVAGIHNQVILRWYTAAKVYISQTTIYDDATANPTSLAQFIRGAVPPATACFFKIRLVGANSDDPTAGTAWFDDVALVAGADTVVGYAENTGANNVYADRIHIATVLSSPVYAAASFLNGFLISMAAVKKNVAGGGNVVVDLRDASTSRLTVTLALPAGLWTIYASAHWQNGDGGGVPITFEGNLVATAIREG